MPSQECPNCHALVPSANDGRCPLCSAPQPGRSGGQPLEQTEVAGPAGSPPVKAAFPEPLIVQALRTSVAGLLMGLVMLGFLVYFVIDEPANRRPDRLGLLAIVGYFVMRMVVAWLFPPRITLTRGTFTLRTPSLVVVRTPWANVADVSLSGGALCLRLHQPNDIESQSQALRRTMMRTAASNGNHFEIPGYRFSVDQVNLVRTALGLPIQYYDEQGLIAAGFEQNLSVATPRPLVTLTVIMACMCLSAAMVFQDSDSLLMPDSLTLVTWGANFGPLTLRTEWWRLLTHQFIHVGALHLAFNMWVLWNIGPLLERMVGRPGFIAGYIFSGFCGGIASMWWDPNRISAGASGALFGLIGMLLGVLVRNRNAIPRDVLRHYLNNAVLFVVLNVALSFTLVNIDASAHLGGLAGGVLFGLLITPAFAEASAWRRGMRLVAAMIACSALGAELYHQVSVRADFSKIIRQNEDEELLRELNRKS